VQRALDRAGGALYLLLPRPIGELLAEQPDLQARRDLLGLTARAERRIALPGTHELGRWLVERTEIVLSLGVPAPVGVRKWVRLGPRDGHLEWGFEY
jgi:hypothetical protein